MPIKRVTGARPPQALGELLEHGSACHSASRSRSSSSSTCALERARALAVDALAHAPPGGARLHERRAPVAGIG